MNITGAKRTNEVTEIEKMNKEVSYNCALEGIVLLENNGVLPIKPCPIALYGLGGIRTVKGGTGSGEVNERHNTTIFEGLSDDGFDVLTIDWLKRSENKLDKEYKEYIDKHRSLDGCGYAFSNPFKLPEEERILNTDLFGEANVAIYVVTRQAGEGADKRIENGDFDLTDMEVESIKTLVEFYKDVIIVINSGSYMSLSKLDGIKYSSLIFYCQEGMEGGRALADLIVGKKSFSGHLSDTWAKNYSDIPYGNEYSYLSNDDNEYYKENIYVGYKYFLTFNKEAKYYFGYGLTYTKFKLELKNYSYTDNYINLIVNVKNIGEFAAKEAVMAFSSFPKGKLDKEAVRLIGFNKTDELSPNMDIDLPIQIKLDYLSSYDSDISSYILDKGNYIIKIGENSNDLTNALVVNISDFINLRKVKNICKIDTDMELLKSDYEINEDISNLPILNINFKDIITEVVDYNYNPSYSQDITDIIDKLTDKDLVELCVGMSYPKLFNSKYIFAPGTVGRTTDKLYNKGIINMNLSDGTSGLRLLRECALTKKGKAKWVEGVYEVSFMELLPKWVIRHITAKPNDERLYQYCTSFPVATAMAQTFNTNLAYRMGEAISKEMDEYNITYFLAPAMNIHKNPLCGRNFEYYSEDPLLSGMMAKSISRGINTIDGNYATIKHFACNNAEFMRMGSNSHVSERALRELYLRGFEIAVKEGDCKSVMTSYNKINGVFTPNIKDLCIDALRCEWNFDGVVMTDWSSTGKLLASPTECIKSGNDLIMPGAKYDKKDLLVSLKNGTLKRSDLEACASNIIKLMLLSNVYRKYRIEDILK